jgi:hypothetical protein
MTAERAEAYGRIMRALHAHFRLAARDEIVRIREACDALVLARSSSPHDRRAMTVAIVVLADLVERGGISRQLAEGMVEDLGRCAPPAPASLETIELP